MKIPLKFILIIVFLLTLFYSEVSQTRIEFKKEHRKFEKDSISNEVDIESIVLSIIELSAVEESKVKAINEILKLTDDQTLMALRNYCFQSQNLKENLSCLVNSLSKIDLNVISLNQSDAKYYIVSACMRMASYKDEQSCLENGVFIINNELLFQVTRQCDFLEKSILKVYCYRKFILSLNK